MKKEQVKSDSMQEWRDKDTEEWEINPRIQNQRVDFTLQNIRDSWWLRPLSFWRRDGMSLLKEQEECLKGRGKPLKGTG